MEGGGGGGEGCREREELDAPFVGAVGAGLLVGAVGVVPGGTAMP